MPTANRAEAPISPEQLHNAAVNYVNCLGLTPDTRVLIITDRLPLTGDADPNLIIRRNMAEQLMGEIGLDHHTALLEIEDKPDDRTLFRRSLDTMQQLDQFNNPEGQKDPFTVVYLAKKWPNRKNLYAAADRFGEGRLLKFAGSLNFTTGDCRVMSEMDEKKLELIREANSYFETFFEEHPSGWFHISTLDNRGVEHHLDLTYDTDRARFESELGHFDGVHETPLGQYPNVRYINIPGGEDYGTPYPFRNANGSFSAEGVIFHVRDGFLVDYEIGEGLDYQDLSTEQRELIEWTDSAKTEGDNSGKFLPISELGLGFYKVAGMKTFRDSSILSKEKNGPHIAFGNVAEDSVEADEIGVLSGNFQHADVLLDDPAITWSPVKNGGRENFYPPEKA